MSEESEGKLQEWSRRSGVLRDHRFFRTSGSSGRPKWIALSHDALEWSARTVVEKFSITPEDRLALALPEFHVGGFGVVERARVSGARLSRYLEKWDARRFAKWCASEEVTVVSLVPTQVHDLVMSNCQGPPSLRLIIVGGGVFDDELRRSALERGWPVLPSYGMTETSSQVATGVGLPLLPGWEAKIIAGRLALRGKGLLSAIVREEQDDFRVEDPKEEGWFLTSDRAEIFEAGLRILGRADRQVKVLGELVDLEDLEGLWRDLLGVEVALLATKDQRRGRSLCLVYEGSVQVIDSLNGKFEGLQRLSEWMQVERLPVTALGKLDRAALEEIYRNRSCNEVPDSGD